jgi:hypothetical protein
MGREEGSGSDLEQLQRLGLAGFRARCVGPRASLQLHNRRDRPMVASGVPVKGARPLVRTHAHAQ